MNMKLFAEALIVYAGALGVIGMFQDYYFIYGTESLTAERVYIKYFIALAVVVSHITIRFQKGRRAGGKDSP